MGLLHGSLENGLPMSNQLPVLDEKPDEIKGCLELKENRNGL